MLKTLLPRATASPAEAASGAGECHTRFVKSFISASFKLFALRLLRLSSQMRQLDKLLTSDAGGLQSKATVVVALVS